MEIKLNAGDKIQIPTGCKAAIKDNQIIIKEKQEEFKEGDILLSKRTGIVVIFSHYKRDDKHIFGSYFNSTNNGPNTGWFTEKFRHATEEEKKAIERLRMVLIDNGENGFIEDEMLRILNTGCVLEDEKED